MSFINPNLSQANFTPGFFSGSSGNSSNTTLIGGGSPFDFPPPPGGLPVPVSYAFNQMQAVQFVVVPLFDGLSPIVKNIIDAVSLSLKAYLPTSLPDISGKSILPSFFKDAVPITNTDIQVYMFARRPSSAAAGNEREQNSLTATGQQFLSFGIPVIQVAPDPDDLAGGEVAEARGSRTPSVYGFETQAGSRLSGVVVAEGGRLSRPQSGTVYGFGEVDTGPASKRASQLEPVDEAASAQIAVRRSVVTDLINSLGGEQAGFELLTDIAHWIDAEQQKEISELVGLNAMHVTHGAKEAARRSIFEKLGIKADDIADFYAAATTLGIDFDNIQKLREASLAMIRDDSAGGLKSLLDLGAKLKSAALNLNENEQAGLEGVVRDLIEKIIIADIVAYYTKAIKGGEVCSSKKAFVQLLEMPSFRGAFEGLRVLEFKERKARIERRIDSEKAQATKSLVSRHQEPEKAAALKEVFEKQGDKRTAEHVARKILTTKKTEFDAEIQALVIQFSKMKATEIADLEGEYPPEVIAQANEEKS